MIRGTIRRRLLVNALVDPEEAAGRLPPGLRPHVSGGATVVGCCLLDIGEVRPAGVPAGLGAGFQAAALRISAEWEVPGDETVVGVFVPVRYCDSRAATVVGGRWFPGAHRLGRLSVVDEGHRLRWSAVPRRESSTFGVEVAVSVDSAPPAVMCDRMATACLGATVAVSPDRRGVLEAVRMEPQHWRAQRVEVERLESAYLAGLSSASLGPSYLMRDVGVTWQSVPLGRALDQVEVLR